MANIFADIRAIKNPYIRLLVLMPVVAVIALWSRGVFIDNRQASDLKDALARREQEVREWKKELILHDSLCSDDKLKIYKAMNEEKERKIKYQDSILLNSKIIRK